MVRSYIKVDSIHLNIYFLKYNKMQEGKCSATIWQLGALKNDVTTKKEIPF